VAALSRNGQLTGAIHGGLSGQAGAQTVTGAFGGFETLPFEAGLARSPHQAYASARRQLGPLVQNGEVRVVDKQAFAPLAGNVARQRERGEF
jgi:hypothetical protein